MMIFVMVSICLIQREIWGIHISLKRNSFNLDSLKKFLSFIIAFVAVASPETSTEDQDESEQNENKKKRNGEERRFG